MKKFRTPWGIALAVEAWTVRAFLFLGESECGERREGKEAKYQARWSQPLVE